LESSGSKLTLLGQSSSAILFKNVVAGEMAFMVEVVVDSGVNGGEFMQGLSIPEFRDGLFSSSKRLV